MTNLMIVLMALGLLALVGAICFLFLTMTGMKILSLVKDKIMKKDEGPSLSDILGEARRTASPPPTQPPPPLVPAVVPSTNTGQQTDPANSNPAPAGGGQQPPTHRTRISQSPESEPEPGWKISWTELGVNTAFFLCCLTLMFIGGIPTDVWAFSVRGFVFTIGLTLLLAQIIYTFMMLKIVLANRRGFIMRFGIILRPAKGLEYVPRPFKELITVTTNLIESDLPDHPDYIFHGDLTKEGSPGIVPEGYTPALRVTFAPAQSTEDILIMTEIMKNPNTRDKVKITIPADDAFNIRLTTEAEFSYGFKVEDPMKLYVEIGGIDAAIESMDDHAIAGFVSRLQKVTLAEAMLTLEEVAQGVKCELTDYSKDWGIYVKFARIKPLGISHALNAVISAVAAARETKKATILASEGQMESLTNIGLGNANARRDFLSGEAEGLREEAEVAETSSGRFAMGAKVTQEAYTASKAVIVQGSDFFGAVAGLKAVMNALPDNGGNLPLSNSTPAPIDQSGQNPPVSVQPQPIQPGKQRYGANSGNIKKGKGKRN